MSIEITNKTTDYLSGEESTARRESRPAGEWVGGPVTRYLRAVFRNNGAARGWLYILLGALPVLLADLTVFCGWAFLHRQELAMLNLTWADYLIAAAFALVTVIKALVAAITALRAYLDQHLSKKE